MARSVAVQRKAVKRDHRQPLSRERVLAAAMKLADREGIAGLSMRRLAQELGVEAMSLYHYFASKSELLAAMVAAVFAEMGLPANSPDWRADVREAAIVAKDALLRHKWVAQLRSDPMPPSRAELEWMDGILGRLRQAGFSANMTHHAYHALDSHIVGFVLWLLPILELADQIPDLAKNLQSLIGEGELPYFMEHVSVHLNEQPGQPSAFDFGLDLILDGLEPMRASG